MLFSNYDYENLNFKDPIVRHCKVIYSVYYKGKEIKSNEGLSENTKGILKNFIKTHLNDEKKKMNFQQYNKTQNNLL